MGFRKLILLLVPLLLVAAVALFLLRGGSRPSGPAVICLDAGHGGAASGAVNGERMEKDDNLALVLRVRELLEASGAELTVVLTREDDTALDPEVSLDLAARTELAAAENATMFVSFHRNSGGGTGIETWTAANPTADDTALAKALQTRLVAVAEVNDRGVRKGTAGNEKTSYFVLSHTAEIPSCLVELGFIDNDTDNTLLDAHFEEYAAAAADGILAAAGLGT